MAITETDPIAHTEETQPEAELLILCLRGFPFSVPVSIDWLALLRLAEKHSVLPLTSEALIANGAEIPAFFQRAVEESRATTTLLAVELEHLLAKFAQHKIEVIPLKGPLLAEALYGDITMRPSADLDLLVRADEFSRAELLLMDDGWVARSAADDYHRGFLRNDMLVELHFGVASPPSFPFDLRGAWDRSSAGTFRAQPIRVMSESDRALHLCLHGLKHGFGKLLWVADLNRALTLAATPDPRELVNRAREHSLEQVLHISCAMVLEVFPQQLPAALIAVLAESTEAAASARANLRRLLVGSATDTNSPELWSFSLQVQAYPLQRWARRWKALAPTGRDDRWAEDHHVPRKLMPLLRPFRLLAKYGPRRVWLAMFPPPA
jgi:putative nucleotidyltransferase-like protein